MRLIVDPHPASSLRSSSDSKEKETPEFCPIFPAMMFFHPHLMAAERANTTNLTCHASAKPLPQPRHGRSSRTGMTFATVVPSSGLNGMIRLAGSTILPQSLQVAFELKYSGGQKAEGGYPLMMSTIARIVFVGALLAAMDRCAADDLISI